MQTSRSGTVKQLLDESRHALEASDAHRALQCVVQALQLLHGDNAVLPTLRAAAEHYHAQAAAPIAELSQLLAQVSIAAEQDLAGQRQQQQQQPHVHQQQQQQPMQLNSQLQQQQQQPCSHQAMHWPSQATPQQHFQHQQHLQSQHHQQQQHLQRQHQQQQQRLQSQHQQQQQLLQSQHQQQQRHQQQQQQQQQQCCQPPGSSQPILEETGRGNFTEAALLDGSSWQCPHCSGVVPMQRQQAHLSYWCPYLQHNNS